MMEVLTDGRRALVDRFIATAFPAPSPPLESGQQRYFTRTGDSNGAVASP